ncbi:MULTISPECIES: HalOD1 output domain-containing protein [Haloarcula]|uniref:Halobacterial output domain-containing protein n=2 Tax=Haloarcula marismortui TaxID=2238 RepID=A0A4P8JZ03_HALMA|nr:MULTISPECIES: HalOD1 output domain-containing protein [Haloarcula]NHN64592.1 hypothetical protein [Haloarcula sp. JP-Z28]NHX39614.1 hypothetical protein [Haloarcula sp. R1-2]EMA14348.1 hypothetical protein C436_06938 [Haloarcula sinaiiensis ATCC 33800]QCP92358.1 hypothetical protein E6P14_16375 [Haloarcula marismortui ATCC 43049]QUJ71652.1 hypothetical protein KDQ40_13280 [Haloarcula sinaiiensis ATCC 33800]
MSGRSPTVIEVHGTDQSIVTAVVRAVATAERQPVETLPPLADSINPDALTACIADSNTSGHVAFDYSGYRVVVDTDGTVTVDE